MPAAMTVSQWQVEGPMTAVLVRWHADEEPDWRAVTETRAGRAVVRVSHPAADLQRVAALMRESRAVPV